MSLIDRLLCGLGAPAWYRRRNQRSLTILMYHGVVEEPLTPFCWHQLARRDFEAQLEHLRAHYKVLPLEEALDRQEAGDLPPNSVALTFDDGFLNNKTIAAPLLERYEMPATIFVVTDLLGTEHVPWPDRLHLAISETSEPRLVTGIADLGTVSLATTEEKNAALARLLGWLKSAAHATRTDYLARWVEALVGDAPLDPGPFRLMDWEDAKALQEGGLIQIAPHTRTHPILSTLPDEAVEPEIRGSRDAIRERLGIKPRVFAYPNGRKQDYDERSIAAVKACLIPYALTTTEGLVKAGFPAREIPRISVGSDLPIRRFVLLASGAWSTLRGKA